jgi:hypothetical protein
MHSRWPLEGIKSNEIKTLFSIFQLQGPYNLTQADWLHAIPWPPTMSGFKLLLFDSKEKENPSYGLRNNLKKYEH